MDGTRTPRVKVCCIADLAEARLAVQFGASALGLVSQMPSGPGVIDDAMIASLARWTPPGVASFLLTSRQSVSAIVEQQRRLRASTLQIVDTLHEGTYDDLRAALPGIRLVQVIHVRGLEALDDAQRVAASVDAILLDSGNPDLAVKELGGTGRRHDWQISRRIRDCVDVPVYLAGGLRPGNVAEAIRTVEPFGLDVCSGVRRDGRLDAGALAAFVTAVRAASDPA